MTVSELITKLQALPGDMEVQVMTSEGNGPYDILQLSRGSWQGENDDDIEWGFESMIEPEFVQDDENGQIAVLVTW